MQNCFYMCLIHYIWKHVRTAAEYIEIKKSIGEKAKTDLITEKNCRNRCIARLNRLVHNINVISGLYNAFPP